MKKKLNLIISAVTLTFVLSAAVAGTATPITYDVNRTVGTGTVTGFIETDGNLGVLGVGDIVDWTLNLVVGADSYTLFGPLSGNNSSVYLQGSDLTATSSQLLFNFSGNDNGYLLFQYEVNVHDGFHYYCDANFSGICLFGETDSPEYYTNGQTVTRSGDVVIASTVPEPGTYALLLSGLGLALRRYKRLR